MNRTATLLCLAALAASCLPALAAPWAVLEALGDNADTTRTLLKQEFSLGDGSGRRMSAGMAVGLHGAVQTQLGRSMAPALSWKLGPQSQLHLMPTSGRGAMLVLQTAP